MSTNQISRIAKMARNGALVANYCLGRFRQHTIWVIGDGRSGTTWLADIINWRKTYREMFEPFHPRFVGTMRSLEPFQYVRPACASESFLQLASSVFTGRLREERVDSQNTAQLYSGLLVKDIFAHLFAAAVAREFPHIKLVVIVRNPFEVALSKLRLRHWWWVEDPRTFLRQGELLADFLHPFETTIRECPDDFVTRQLMIWAVIHYVLFEQIKDIRAHVISYEALRDSPESQIGALLQFLQPNQLAPSVPAEMLRASEKRSRATARPPGADCGDWRTKLSSAQMAAGAAILSRFGLSSAYDLDGTPSLDALSALVSTSPSREQPSLRATSDCPVL